MQRPLLFNHSQIVCRIPTPPPPPPPPPRPPPPQKKKTANQEGLSPNLCIQLVFLK